MGASEHPASCARRCGRGANPSRPQAASPTPVGLGRTVYGRSQGPTTLPSGPLQRPFRLASPPLHQILAGKRNITADTALRLGRYFGMSADFWMNLQSAYELDLARKQSGKAIQRIPRRAGRPPEGRSVASRGGGSG
jgi:addiction module HigA family antidote